MMREVFEEIASGEAESDFNMTALVRRAWPHIEEHLGLQPVSQSLELALGRSYTKLKAAILRHVFLIELVSLPAVNTTRVRVRWSRLLEDDPRRCSYDECLLIARDLLDELNQGWLDVADNKEALQLCFNNNLIPYEVPLDYRDRPLGDNPPPIHRRENLYWVSDQVILRTLKLRNFLRSQNTSPDHQFFRKVLKDKIAVKTYLTDRVQTGNYQTNREKRWEVHPKSVHFANRQTCMAIEYKLICQLCELEGFPEHAQNMLQEEGALPANLEVLRCPITLEPMRYRDFHNQLTNPVAGRSDFHVGHLNPLKLNDPNANAAGHTPENISWVSADGNRIQGSLSLAELRALLQRIAANYEAQGWI